jgi:small subunit ribosomal protein S9
MVKYYNVKACRKEATARAVIKPGAGNVRINNKAIDVFCAGLRKQMVLEASYVAEDEFSRFDYFITVKGGGVKSQLQCARNCIAKGLLLANGNKKALKEKL